MARLLAYVMFLVTVCAGLATRAGLPTKLQTVNVRLILADMPKPRDDETRYEFIERCIPIVIDDGTAEDGQQAYAVCSSIWRQDTKMHNKKSFKTHMKLNDEDGHEGEFTAHFATLNVIDHDGDVTIPGAFYDGQEAIVESWNHDYGLPAGKGTIHSDDTRVWMTGKFFLNTEVGRENYNTVKNMGDLAEWSYTFNIEDAKPGKFQERDVNYLMKLDVWGVSPVTRGAGMGTHTIDIKSQKQDDANKNEGEADDEGKPSGEVSITKTKIEILEV